MKKAILSSFVVVSFIIYAIFEQSKSFSFGDDASPVTKVATSTPTSIPIIPVTTQTNTSVGAYKDGQYTGAIADAFYGNVQVQAIIKSGQITDVKFLDYPHDRGNSIEINSQAMPMLTAEAIRAQTYNVDIVSGATATSQAFIQSLQSALAQAK